MTITLPTKDVGEVQDKIAKHFEEKRTLEDAQSEYIKRSMQLEDDNGRW